MKGKQVIITGGASGIGLAMVKRFLEAGLKVHVLEINSETAKENLAPLGANVSVYQCDISKTKEVQNIIDQICKKANIDILINNAGIAHVGNVEQTEEADLDRLYQVNIKGVYNCIKALIPHFKNNGGGVILNVASIASTVGIADRFAYSMTKGAVLTMTYSVAKDYLSHHIRCNSISPARVHTPFVDGFIAKNYPDNQTEMFEKLSKTQPIGRMGQPAEIAALAYFLCSDEAAFLTGTDYPIDGGYIKLNG
jgi:NAD(P)-dependent dehydrogenase (short-subunit alcohol dehydrogenase family)